MKKLLLNSISVATTLLVLFSCKEESLNLSPEDSSWKGQTRAAIETLDANSMRVLSSSESSLVMELEVSNYAKNAVSIEGKDYFSITARDAHSMLQKGNPDLPEYAYSVVIPQTSACNVRVVNAEYEDITLPVAPSKGSIPGLTDPSSIPYTFSEVYEKDTFYPSRLVSADAPFLMRDIRGSVVRLHPFQYNPVTGILRVYKKMEVEVSFSGTDDRNVLTSGVRHTIDESMEELFRNMFINYDVMAASSVSKQLPRITGGAKDVKGPPPSEKMLIICCDSFATDMSNFMTHKTSLGITTRLVTMSQVETTAGDVATYIQEKDYQINSNLTYVLLVGDAERVPTIMIDDEGNPGHDGGSDTFYGLVSGGDSIPDIYIGRFSAKTRSEVQTMVNRTIFYENMSVQTWQHRSVGISDDANISGYYAPNTPYDYIESIMCTLTSSTYGTVGAVSVHSSDYTGYSAINSAISSAINQGAFVVNFIGRGHIKYWYPGYFTTGSVGNLTNDNKLPFIYNAAPYVGCFTNSYYATPPCLAEAFLTACNSSTGAATGAIGVFASSISAPYYELITAELNFNNILATYSSVTRNFGVLCYNSAINMRNQFGSAATYILLTMNYFGDPSLRVIPNAYVSLPVVD